MKPGIFRSREDNPEDVVKKLMAAHVCWCGKSSKSLSPLPSPVSVHTVHETSVYRVHRHRERERDADAVLFRLGPRSLEVSVQVYIRYTYEYIVCTCIAVPVSFTCMYVERFLRALLSYTPTYVHVSRVIGKYICMHHTYLEHWSPVCIHCGIF